ncbi:hypothetical protein JCM3770_003652 [Rhodotorula araucariae]
MAQPAGPIPLGRAAPHAGGSGALAHPAPHAPTPHAALAPHATGKRQAVLSLSDSSDGEAPALATAKRARIVETDARGPDREDPRADVRRAGFALSSDDDLEYMALDLSDVDPDEYRLAHALVSPRGAAGRADATARGDPLDSAVGTVAGILPDVDLAVVRMLLAGEPALGPVNVEAVLDTLFAWEGGYPKRTGPEAGEGSTKGGAKGKGKAREEHEGEQAVEEDDNEVQRAAKQWIDTATRNTGGKAYEDAALAQLYLDFPTVRQSDLKKLFVSNSHFYAPAYIAIEQAFQEPADTRPFKLIATARVDKGKGKDKVNDELEKEKTWVQNERSRYTSALRRATELEARLEAEIASGAYFECGCCFADVGLSQMIACAEGCQFCKDCARMNADSQIGMRKYVLPCMSTSGCTSTFLESEYPLFLPRKTVAALHKIKQEKEVDEAALEGLEKCPFCVFAMIIENEHERLFHCQHEGCRIKDHLPATCAEASEDAKLSTVHRIEEAMSEALIRRCPKAGCGEPYVKEQGTCNKIRCASCATLSCYICNKVIVGYQHFTNAGSNMPVGATTEAGSTCVLWDDTGKRNFEEVEAARLAAEDAARAANPALAAADLAKLAMEAPPPPPANIAHLPPPRLDDRVRAILDARGAGAPPPPPPAAPRWRGAPPPPAQLPPPPALVRAGKHPVHRDRKGVHFGAPPPPPQQQPAAPVTGPAVPRAAAPAQGARYAPYPRTRVGALAAMRADGERRKQEALQQTGARALEAARAERAGMARQDRREKEREMEQEEDREERRNRTKGKG